MAREPVDTQCLRDHQIMTRGPVGAPCNIWVPQVPHGRAVDVLFLAAKDPKQHSRILGGEPKTCTG